MSDSNSKTYFVTGGGTGGHIYPAIAVADALSHNGAAVYYVGNRNNMEASLAVENGYKFLHVGVKGMPRKLSPRFLSWGIRLIKYILRSLRYLKKYKPNAVFATGGYVSAPLVIACILTKTPYVMHDCDAMPGLVTRSLSQNAKYVTLAFEKAKQFIPNKNTVLTGNPIREKFKTLTEVEARRNLGLKKKLTLCIMGGSQGAKTINNTALELIREFVKNFNLQVIFQTGRKNYDEVLSKLKYLYPDYEEDANLIVRPYFDDMISVLKASDIVISRAGSLSLSEICASSVAPILVPYPYAAANHQRLNARCLLETGACIYIEDEEIEPNVIREKILELIKNPAKIEYLKQNSFYLAKFDASKQIAELIESL